MILSVENQAVYEQVEETLLQNAGVRELDSYVQHKGGSRLAHSLFVARVSLLLSQILPCEIDSHSMLRGAILHDYYLYERREIELRALRHGLLHPLVALDNAEQIVLLNDKERNIILSHMWPLSRVLPRSREAVLVCLADKICAVGEFSAAMARRFRGNILRRANACL